ncbi:MAG: leucine-rich repeat domain-containing protein [Blautia sp.]|nr:leucine-rich repeat domain-containing protein [Blautia sp.]
MKRKLYIILALAAVLAVLVCGTALADTNGVCGEDLTWSLNAAGRLTISGTGDMYDYNYSNNLSPFKGDLSIRSLEVGAGVTSIGSYFLWKCGNLTSISLPDGLLSIGAGAFQECYLSHLNLPDTVESIGADAFFGNDNVSSLTLPKNMAVIGRSAFNGMQGLSEVYMPEGLKIIGDQAFYACTGIEDIEIPAGVTSIGDSAFSGCANLYSITILSPNVTFGSNVFPQYPQDLMFRGWTASTTETFARKADCYFESIGSLSGFCGDQVSWTLDPVEGVLNITGSGDMWDDNISTDEFDGFRDNRWIRSVVIGNGVTSIGDGVCNGCANLTSISIGDSVAKIGVDAFGICTSLKEVVIPAGVTEIRDRAFQYCSSLKSVMILNPDAVIGDYSLGVFLQCPGLTIYGYAGSTAEDYSDAAAIRFQPFIGQCGSNMSWSFDAASGELCITGTGAMTEYEDPFGTPWYPIRRLITSVYIGPGVNSICAGAFYACRSVEAVDFPDSLTHIGSNAFYYCSSLTAVELPGHLTSMGSKVFESCRGLYEVTLPAGMNSIPEGTFLDCRSLEGIVIPEGVETIWASAFSGAGLTDVSIPHSVTGIDSSAFKDCKQLQGVTILNPDTVIGDLHRDVFENCDDDLTLYGWTSSTAQSYANAAGIRFASLGSLSGRCGDNVFYTLDPVTGTLHITGSGEMWDYFDSIPSPFHGSSQIRSVVIEDGVTAVGEKDFSDCTALESVTIPDSVTFLGAFAFSGCVRLPGVTILNPGVFFGGEGKDVFSGTEDSFTIYGWPLSTAEAYALSVGIPFVPLAPAPTFFLPSSLTTIEEDAFRSIPALAVFIPGTVTTIEGDPFAFDKESEADTGSNGAVACVQYIYGVPGTAAEAFARNYRYTFIPVSAEWRYDS